MKRDPFSKLLYRCYDTYQYHLKAYPKRAKCARTRKKWWNRFGPGVTEIIRSTSENLFLKLIPRYKEFSGMQIRIPLFEGGDLALADLDPTQSEVQPESQKEGMLADDLAVRMVVEDDLHPLTHNRD